MDITACKLLSHLNPGKMLSEKKVLSSWNFTGSSWCLHLSCVPSDIKHTCFEWACCAASINEDKISSHVIPIQLIYPNVTMSP